MHEEEPTSEISKQPCEPSKTLSKTAILFVFIGFVGIFCGGIALVWLMHPFYVFPIGHPNSKGYLGPGLPGIGIMQAFFTFVTLGPVSLLCVIISSICLVHALRNLFCSPKEEDKSGLLWGCFVFNVIILVILTFTVYFIAVIHEI